jgi:DNA invertase Pin-like site-specific DNA recombinase
MPAKESSIPSTLAQPERVTRCAIYSRVSTCNGHQDPEMQARELREYCAHRGFRVVGEYVDRLSGSKDSRPALNELMAAAHRRQFDAVCVWKLDRWGRSLKHLVNSIAELEARGVAFIALRDNLDLSTPSGRLMFHVIVAMAEFERSLIVERTKAGLRNARARGRHLGRPRAVFDVARAASLRNSGTSWRAISKQLGVPRSTLHLALNGRPESPSGSAPEARL